MAAREDCCREPPAPSEGELGQIVPAFPEHRIDYLSDLRQRKHRDHQTSAHPFARHSTRSRYRAAHARAVHRRVLKQVERSVPHRG